MLKKTFFAMTAALLLSVGTVVAQDSSAPATGGVAGGSEDAENVMPGIKLRGTKAIANNDAGAEKDADKARKVPIITVVSGLPEGDLGGVPPEGGPGDPPKDPPPPESDEDPTPEDDDTPKFFGEPVSGKFDIIMDRSGSMSSSDAGSGPIEDVNGGIISTPNRIQRVKAEATKLLNQLSETDEFALQSFGGGVQEQVYYEALVKADSSGIQQGLQFIQDMHASGHTPAYSALKIGCTQYGNDLDKMFFLCDGQPNSDMGAPGNNGRPAAIIADFPAWYASLKAAGCQLVCIHIGNSGAAEQFMLALAGAGNGIYVKR